MLIVQDSIRCFSENTLLNLSRFITILCHEDPVIWRDVLKKLENLNLQNDRDLLTDLNLNKAHEIMSVFGIELEKD